MSAPAQGMIDLVDPVIRKSTLPKCPECGCDDMCDLTAYACTEPPSANGSLYCPVCDRVTLRGGERESLRTTV